MSAVSVIVLNYNGMRWLPGCLDAIAAQSGAPSFQTLVIDNGSSDGSVAFTRTSYPTVELVETGQNLGFCAGNNRGARVASGEWLAFLNNDTIVDPGWLAALWRASIAHPEFTLITSRLVFLHDPSTIDSAGDGYLRAGGGFKYGHGAPAASWTSPREVFGACGGAFMIRRDAFEALGGFDERFFMIYEDVDLSYRARLRGLRVWYAAEAIVRHAGSATVGSSSAEAVFFGQRNLEWAWIKNTPRALLLRSAAAHVAYSLAGLVHYARQGRGGAAVRGKIAALGGLPAVLADRRRVQSSRVVEPAAIARHMEPRWIALKRREKAFAAARVSGP